MDRPRLLFVRFGRPPPNGRSRNVRDKCLEAGVSVYEAIEREGRIQLLVPSWGDVTVFTTMGVTMDAHQGRMKRPCPAFEVEGAVVGAGSDGEPVLAPCRIIREIPAEQFDG